MWVLKCQTARNFRGHLASYDYRMELEELKDCPRIKRKGNTQYFFQIIPPDKTVLIFLYQYTLYLQ